MKRTWILELFISIENTRPRGFYIGFGTETARIPGFADIQHTFHSIFNLPSFCTPWAKIGLYKFGTVQKISCTGLPFVQERCAKYRGQYGTKRSGQYKRF